MNKTRVVLAGCCTLFFCAMGVAGKTKSNTNYAVQDSAHEDGRKTPKLEFNPSFVSRSGARGEELAREYLVSRAARYGLPADLSNLRLQKVKHSLHGIHYHFQQKLNEVDVDKAEIIVSVLAKEQRVYQVFNNTFPLKTPPAPLRTKLGENAAYDAAWEALQVRGKLMASPVSRLSYVFHEGQPVLVYLVDLSVEDPHGAWRVTVDAASGKVLEKENLLLPRAKHGHSHKAKRSHGPLLNRKKAFEAFGKETASRHRHWTRAAGTGLVFDPDPRTTLLDDTLKDDSSADKFESAYFSRNLLDIGFADGKYSLVGPWVQIVDFESPTNAPSTTTDGNWTAKRGNNAFNDVMTYYHLDANQRYIQSLGFTGDKGIQFGSIQVDSDGYGGSDNSYFSPAANKIAFGHGCVDDNEDADVILHEYGHAIHHSINSNWSGGDTGGMGEGFGDYWAASYSISTPNGLSFNKNHVFNWDGHGEGNPCWPGRILNAFNAQYDPNKSYGAHQSIAGGFQSDELWSTPLFQALLALMEAGVSRESVDAIILEAHFGLGARVKMPEMARAILATAQRFSDNPAVANTFLNQFVNHKILNVPTPAMETLVPQIVDSGANGMVDPGERVELRIPLKNTGTAAGTAVTGVLSSSQPGVRVVEGNVVYGDLGMGQSASGGSSFVIEVDETFVCGETIDLNLHVSFDKARAYSMDVTLSLPSGEAIGTQLMAEPKLAIPDNSETGISSELVLSDVAAVSGNFSVQLDIEHPYQGDLTVVLESPAGTRVKLHDESGGSTDNLLGSYPETLTPAETLDVLQGESLSGIWKLIVSDNAGSDTGTLNKWGIQAVTGHVCQ